MYFHIRTNVRPLFAGVFLFWVEFSAMDDGRFSFWVLDGKFFGGMHGYSRVAVQFMADVWKSAWEFV